MPGTRQKHVQGRLCMSIWIMKIQSVHTKMRSGMPSTRPSLFSVKKASIKIDKQSRLLKRRLMKHMFGMYGQERKILVRDYCAWRRGMPCCNHGVGTEGFGCWLSTVATPEILYAHEHIFDYSAPPSRNV